VRQTPVRKRFLMLGPPRIKNPIRTNDVLLWSTIFVCYTQEVLQSPTAGIVSAAEIRRQEKRRDYHATKQGE